MMRIENPSEYSVSAVCSDGFYFIQNKNNLIYLYLYSAMDTQTNTKENLQLRPNIVEAQFIYDTEGKSPISLI